MHTKKTIIMGAAGTVVGLAALAGVASAQTPASTNQQSLVDKIATKFNLDKSDVQAVFDEDHATHEAEMQQKMDERLSQAVTDGKITEAQKTAIQEKQKELKSYLDSIKDKSDTERHQLMKAKLDEVEQWAKDNGLSTYFHPMMRGPGHGGMGMRGMDSSTDNSN